MNYKNLHDRGFTLVEVIIVIAITTIGFVALLNLQIGTLHTASASRDMQEAINLAEHVSQTMRLEALQWTPTKNPSDLITARYLNNAPTDVTEGAATQWLVAYPATEGQPDGRISAVGSDMQYDTGIIGEIGSDVRANYCVHYRLTWLVPNMLLRADVRVLWPRNQAVFSKYSNCAVGMESALQDINSITTPITIIRNVFVNQV